jgi:hypothetical protein
LKIRYTTVAKRTKIMRIATQPQGTFFNEKRAAAERPLLLWVCVG